MLNETAKKMLALIVYNPSGPVLRTFVEEHAGELSPQSQGSILELARTSDQHVAGQLSVGVLGLAIGKCIEACRLPRDKNSPAKIK